MMILNKASNIVHSARLVADDLARGFTPYVGLPTNGNLGDELLYRLALRYLSSVNLVCDLSSRGRFLKISLLKASGYYFVGGGSLIFGSDFLAKFEKLKRLGLSPVFWGTGSRELFLNADERSRWQNVLQESSGGVRGSITAESFQKIGLNAKVIGDMGFLVNLDFETVPLPENYVVVVPRLIPPRSSELHLLDLQRLAQLNVLIKYLYSQGMGVVVYLPDIFDKSGLADWLAGLPRFVQVFNYAGSAEPFLELVSSASAIVSMRLHPGLFAYSLGVPTMFIESRNKYYDAISILAKKPGVLDVPDMSKDLLIEGVRHLASEPHHLRLERFYAVRDIAHSQMEASREIAARLPQTV